MVEPFFGLVTRSDEIGRLKAEAEATEATEADIKTEMGDTKSESSDQDKAEESRDAMDEGGLWGCCGGRAAVVVGVWVAVVVGLLQSGLACCCAVCCHGWATRPVVSVLL